MLNKLEKMWTQEGGLDDLYKGSGCLFSLVSVICTLAWQLDLETQLIESRGRSEHYCYCQQQKAGQEEKGQHYS